MHRTLRVLAMVLILGLAGKLFAQVADPPPSPELAYEGRLIESGALVTGTRPFVFSILDSNGNVLWNSGQQILTVTGGLYAMVLGATGMPAIPASLMLKADLTLHVLADGVALSPDISLVPSLQSSTAWEVLAPFLGDISGTQQTISVDKLKGTPIDLTAGPSAGQVLTFNGTSWTATTPAGAGGGAQGPAGPQGIQGPAGPMGLPGINGANGTNGSNGAAGASPFTLDGSNAVFTTGSVGIGVDPPSATAILDVASTTQGFLAPRMTTVQRLAITTPANGLIVFDTTAKSLEVYDAVGAVWNPLGASAGTGNGTVSNVTGTFPIIVANGTTTPAISLGTVPVASGGTGATTLTGYLLGAGSSPVTASATIPGAAITGNITGNAANVTGTVPVANGGTGAISLTGYLLGAGTGAVTATPTIPIANGGTGAATATAAITNLLPSQTGFPGEVLSTNGTVASWSAALAGTVTSVTGTSPIVVATGTSTPAITLATVPVADGGTGDTTISGYLFGNGASAVTGSATIPGSVISGNVTGSAANVTGTVAVANGGTGAVTFPQGQLLFGTTTTPISSSSALFWDSTNSRLGIGTSSPSYPLQVTTSVGASLGSYGFLNSGGTGTAAGGGNVGIYANARVVAQEVDAVSDARIKNILGPSDTSADLKTLRKLKITDYRYIDVVEKGNQPKKGVIAQEVESVYPGAVRIMSDFIPSVYVMANKVSYDAAKQELTVTVQKAHGFAVGDMVRIIADTDTVEEPVVAVLSGNTFVLSGVAEATSKAFVYGKKVADFRSVDYDQLFSMNIGATQQLASDNDALKAANQALTTHVAALEAENQALATRLAALEAAVGALRSHPTAVVTASAK